MMCNVYELKAGKALDWDWPHNKKRKDDFDLKVFIGAMALGIKHMHEKNVVHLDGHPANMMTDEKGYPVWIDFGCSQTGITKPNEGCNTHVVGWPGGQVPEIKAFHRGKGIGKDENGKDHPKGFGQMTDWYILG